VQEGKRKKKVKHQVLKVARLGGKKSLWMKIRYLKSLHYKELLFYLYHVLWKFPKARFLKELRREN
jgi:hypothetical protein